MLRKTPYPKENPTASTRITIVLDVQHEPEIDLPLRAAEFLQRTLSDVEGFERVAVIRGETEEVGWTPRRPRMASSA
jgi:hypothetical protein